MDAVDNAQGAQLDDGFSEQADQLHQMQGELFGN